VETSPPSAAPLERRRDRNLRLDIGEEDKRKKKQQQQSSTLEGSGKTRGKESTLSKLVHISARDVVFSFKTVLKLKTGSISLATSVRIYCFVVLPIEDCINMGRNS